MKLFLLICTAMFSQFTFSQTPVMSIPSLTVEHGSGNFTLSIYIENIDIQSGEYLQIDMTYNPDVIQLLGIDLHGTLIEDIQYTSWLGEGPGKVTLGIHGEGMKFNQNGYVINLVGREIGQGHSILDFGWLITNESIYPKKPPEPDEVNHGQGSVIVTPHPNTPIYFDDPNFDRAIRNLLGKSSREVLTYEMVSDITELDISNLGISSLEGIQWFTALKRLDASFNLLSGIAPLLDHPTFGLLNPGFKGFTLDLRQNYLTLHGFDVMLLLKREFYEIHLSPQNGIWKQ